MKKLREAFEIIFALFLITGCAASNQMKTIQPLLFIGYHDLRWSEYVAMDDGTRIAVDIYLPRVRSAKTSLPAVLQYMPYSRTYVDPGLSRSNRALAAVAFGIGGSVIPNPSDFDQRLLAHGYALLFADMRGTGASFGSRFELMPERVGKDGAQLVEWIARQKWCNGKVGMYGGSYLGISQILTAAQKPPSLKCIMPAVYPLVYTDFYPGGIYNQGFMIPYSEMLWTFNTNQLKQIPFITTPFPLMPAAPVVDEDRDGKVVDEIPLDQNGNGLFLDDYQYPADPNDPPQYRDGKKREHLYYLATLEHTQNFQLHDWMSKLKFIDTRLDEIIPDPSRLPPEIGKQTGYELNALAYVPAVMASGIPIYHVGGWMDAQPRSTMLFYATAARTNPSKLMVYPGYHHPEGPYIEYFGETEKSVSDKVFKERLRFFDHYLKGIENGIDQDPPITLYVMGKGWRTEKEWPLQRQKITDYYFQAGNQLAATPAEAGADRYPCDFTHDSSYGTDQANRWVMVISPDQLPIRTEKDKLCLTYTTAPLDQDTEVTGHPILEFWASSSADDGDFFAYLEEVTEKGEALLVTEGSLRAGFAAFHDPDQMLLRGKTQIKILLDLPWHGYDAKDYQERIFANRAIVRLKFDLQPTAWVFQKGHRIRISIACADWPTFQLNPALAPTNRPSDPANLIPAIILCHDPQHPSHISLPLIPN